MKKIPAVIRRILSERALLLVDVGSLGGVKAPWSQVAEYIRIVSFEPQEHGSGDADAQGNRIVGDVALGAAAESAVLYVTNHPANSSVLRPNQRLMDEFAVKDRYKIASQQSVAIDTLDAWLSRAGIRGAAFLKVDTQGSEGAVLAGAGETLRTTLGVDIEINFAPRYEGQSFFSDIDARLRAGGFALFDLQRRYFKRLFGLRFGGPKGQLTHGTALYFRSLGSFEELLQPLNQEERRFFVAGFMAVVLLYGYDDYALTILSRFGDVFSGAERREIETAVTGDVRWNERLPRFWGRGHAAGLFSRLARLFRVPARFGNTGDSDLGNVL